MNHVWIGLRVDGIELARVRSACVEESRENGIVTYRCPGDVMFADVLTDIDAAHLTLHASASGPPFTAGRMPVYGPIRAGESMQVKGGITFEKVIEVPWHTNRAVFPDLP